MLAEIEAAFELILLMFFKMFVLSLNMFAEISAFFAVKAEFMLIIFV